MIEIQCTSCHTRYRIDERVLPADNPTFKCSRCGHVFTTDPVAAKKIVPEPSPKPQTPRTSTPRADPKLDAPSSFSAPPKAPQKTTDAAPKSVQPQEPADAAKPHLAPESKPAPLKPYIRSQRPTVFDRAPEAPPTKPAAEASSTVDAAAVARMRASMEAPKSSATAEPPHSAPEARPPTPEPPPRMPEPPRRASESPRPIATSSRAAQNDPRDDGSENLEFDFSDESQPELGHESGDDGGSASAERWSVGDEPLARPQARQPRYSRSEPDPGFTRGEPAPIGRGTIPQYAGNIPIQRSALPDERAYIERAGLHSARSFIGLFFVVALMFVALTLVIYGIPSASAELLRRMPVIGPEFVQPTRLENQVSVSDVQSSYQTLKGGHRALVLTGTLKNNSEVPLHTIQIGVRLLDLSQHEVASSAVNCGTTLSPKMIGEMTPHELEFLQKLDPQKTFVLEPGRAAPFLMVFIDPPREVRHFAVAVSRAQPPATVQASVQR